MLFYNIYIYIYMLYQVMLHYDILCSDLKSAANAAFHRGGSPFLTIIIPRLYRLLHQDLPDAPTSQTCRKASSTTEVRRGFTLGSQSSDRDPDSGRGGHTLGGVASRARREPPAPPGPGPAPPTRDDVDPLPFGTLSLLLFVMEMYCV